MKNKTVIISEEHDIITITTERQCKCGNFVVFRIYKLDASSWMCEETTPCGCVHHEPEHASKEAAVMAALGL